MDSVTKTGTCLRPSCTAIVCPSMSGTIIERRDQVLMTILVPASFWTSAFFCRWSSTKGPFFKLRGISRLLSALLATTADNELVAVLVGVPGSTLGLAPWTDRVTSTGGLTLTATMWVVHRVHRDTTHCRAFALPAHAAGLTPVDVALFGVADLADRCATAQVHVSDLTGGHT